MRLSLRRRIRSPLPRKPPRHRRYGPRLPELRLRIRLPTRPLSVFLARSLRPFRFTKTGPEPSFWPAPRLGLYVHVPFCRTLCDFCPYNRLPWEASTARAYMASLGREAELIADRIDGRATSGSLYFGGGSPALALDFFNPLLKTLEGRFDLRGPRAIELHPSDTSSDTISRLRDLGFDQVSLGAQTFSEGLHARIGRDWSDPAPALGRLASAGFPTLDVDILFGLPGQTEELLEADLRRAVALGATQISTYPFIRFSYTRTPQVIPGIAARRRLLRHLTETATELGLERRSIWTFARPDTPGYSSVTRDNFIGFGASAASLLPDIFRINTFSVPAYIAAIGEGRIPTALTLVFTARTRALFWLFWSCYRTIIRGADYEGLFGRSLEADFGFELSLGRLIGLFEGGEGEYVLTRRGRYLFHLVEQAYTSDYIDRTWSTCRSEPWPKGLELR